MSRDFKINGCSFDENTPVGECVPAIRPLARSCVESESRIAPGIRFRRRLIE